MHTAEAGTMGDLSVHERGIETPEQQEQRRIPEAASIWVRNSGSRGLRMAQLEAGRA